MGNYDSKHTLLRSTLPNHWCTRPFAQCTIKKKNRMRTTKKAGNFCEYHVQSLRCRLYARKKIHRQQCQCFCIQHYNAIQNVGEKNINEKKCNWCTGIMSRMAVEGCTTKTKGEKPDPANKRMRAIDVPISRRCAATKPPSIGYTTSAAFGYMQPKQKKNIQKILKKQRPQETEWKGKRSKRTFQMTKKTRGKNKKNTDLEHGKDRTQILRYMVQAVCTHMRGGEEKNRKGKKSGSSPQHRWLRLITENFRPFWGQQNILWEIIARPSAPDGRWKQKHSLLNLPAQWCRSPSTNIGTLKLKLNEHEKERKKRREE